MMQEIKAETSRTAGRNEPTRFPGWTGAGPLGQCPNVPLVFGVSQNANVKERLIAKSIVEEQREPWRIFDRNVGAGSPECLESRDFDCPGLWLVPSGNLFEFQNMRSN